LSPEPVDDEASKDLNMNPLLKEDLKWDLGKGNFLVLEPPLDGCND
jgi:hypothetical protein